MARRERVMVLEPFGKGIMGTNLLIRGSAACAAQRALIPDADSSDGGRAA